jgi:FtsP/CotA-like multicopper oxidase with cupredoxin domain
MWARALVPLSLLPLIASFAPPVGHTRSAPPTTRRSAERVAANDNRRAAGTLRDGVLTVRLEARVGAWHPDGDDAPGADVPAFAEVGKPPQIPGPLLRVVAGTRVSATVRNSLPNDTLVVHGLHSRGAPPASPAPIRLAPLEQREVTFRLDATGTFYYWGTTMGRELRYRTREDAQLSGAIVVDEPGAGRPHDRVFVLGMWSDTVGAAMPHGRKRLLFVINGMSWPHTERLSATVGDSVRWRVINASADLHPMHLHGFYFRVDGRGDGTRDTTYAEPDRDRVVTELMTQGQTMRLSWVPERDGNWAFHCHVPEHIMARGPLGMLRDADHGHVANHALQGMGGLVMGVTVKPRRGAASTATRAVPGRRAFRLVVGEDPAIGPRQAMTFSLGDARTAPARDTTRRLGPSIVVTRGEPVSITVVNQSSQPTAVHWHGIELESYFDGIPGFSGTPTRLSPVIAPRDSFEARFTPPRAGTFIYHSHVDEEKQQPAGLTGPIIVLEPGQRYDPTTDLVAIFTSPLDSAQEARAVLINGLLDPTPLTLRVGVPHRLRMVNITVARPGLRVALHQDTSLVSWRLLARDGAELAEHRRVVRPASQPLTIGQTIDVEITPRAIGTLQLSARAAVGPVLRTVTLRVIE